MVSEARGIHQTICTFHSYLLADRSNIGVLEEREGSFFEFTIESIEKILTQVGHKYISNGEPKRKIRLSKHLDTRAMELRYHLCGEQ